MKTKLLIVVALLSAIVIADGGMIPWKPAANIYEPGQKAIIAWNGAQETLILSVDVYSSEETKVLQIIPFPLPPEIEAGSFDSFTELDHLMYEKGLGRTNKATAGYGQDALGAGAPESAVDIIFHEKIGSHDITTAHIMNWQGFNDWANTFLQGKNFTGSFDAKVQQTLQYYFDMNIQYFVFDIMDIDETQKSKEPIKYTFETENLFFPLKISSLQEGQTEVQLFVITPYKPTEYHFQGAGMDVLGQARVNEDEINDIDYSLGDIISGEGWLTIAQTEQDIKDFTNDLYLGWPSALSAQTCGDVYSDICRNYCLEQQLSGAAAGLVFGLIIGAAAILLKQRKPKKKRK